MSATAWAIAGILAISPGTPLRGQTPPNPPAASHHGRLVGVFDESTGDPIEGVRVGDLLTGTYATTTKTGTVSLAFLPPGGGMVRIQKIGYAVQTMFVAVTPADTTPLTIVLERVTELPAVVTKGDSSPSYLSPILRGFEERRQSHSGGYFLSDADLRKLENTTVANAIRRFPGVVLLDGPGSATFLMPTVRCADGSHAGPPAIFLDGVEVLPTFPRPGTDINKVALNVNQFQIASLAGVEFYPDNSVAPIEFPHTSARCGLLLLWTRER